MSAIRTVLILVFLMFLFSPVTAYAATGPDTSLCIQCHGSMEAEIGHTQVAGQPGACLDCHAPHSMAGTPALSTPPMDRCVGCHSQFSSGTLNKDEQSGLTVHDPVHGQNCSICHLPHTSFDSPGFVGGDKNASCVSCHSNTMAAAEQLPDLHPPFENGQCTSCHDPHVSKQANLLKGPVDDLCYMCHDNTVDRGQLPVQHQPFADGDCTRCHSGHASANPAMLVESASQLCLDCHTPKDGNGKYPHGPYETGDCLACHSPHSSRTAGLVNADSERDLCLSCHSGSGTASGSTPSHPLSATMHCTGCHSPHASDTEGVFPGAGTNCTACHTQQNTHFASSPHGACTACHQTHGSPEGPLPAGSTNDLCLKCHEARPHGEHPVGGEVRDATGKAVTCVSCHDPHGSPYAHSLVRAGDGLCLGCHSF